jgi:ABC-type transport system involved in cytochrome bd biosynthesis fused ATPase/permease subunit
VAGLSILAIGVWISRFDFRLAWVLFALLLAAGLGLPFLIRILSRRTGIEIIGKRAALNVSLVDGVQGLADLLAFDLGERQMERIRLFGGALVGLQRRMAITSGLQTALSGLLANLGLWSVLSMAIPLASEGQIPGVFLAVIALAALTSFEAVSPLPLAAHQMDASLQAARRLFEVVDSQPQVQDPVEPLPLPGDLSLEVNDLRFRYPVPIFRSTERSEVQTWALDGVGFSLPQGKKLAVIGPSGAGKSTLINLLLRFWEYKAEGQIRLGGKDLFWYAQEDLRGIMGVVPQGVYLFNASVLDNLRIASPQATREEVEWAARQAQMHDFILSLPQGYDTQIGEQGLRLSGGERQRLAIARALLRRAPLLILDEPTANLDPMTEQKIMQALLGSVENRSILLVTHRLVGLENFDEILVLERGRVIERGQHTYLMEVNGLYRKMWETQRQQLWD